jgi:hypothetical protein
MEAYIIKTQITAFNFWKFFLDNPSIWEEVSKHLTLFQAYKFWYIYFRKSWYSPSTVCAFCLNNNECDFEDRYSLTPYGEIVKSPPKFICEEMRRMKDKEEKKELKTPITFVQMQYIKKYPIGTGTFIKIVAKGHLKSNLTKEAKINKKGRKKGLKKEEIKKEDRKEESVVHSGKKKAKTVPGGTGGKKRKKPE